MATAFKTSEDTNDITFTNGSITLVTAAAQVAQNVEENLSFFKGEFFLDLEQGVPYWQEFFVRPLDLLYIEFTLRDVILATPGVVSIDTFNLEFDKTTRKATVATFVVTEYADEAQKIEVTL